MSEEIGVLESQLDELLDEGAIDADDALEIAVVAGLAARLKADPGVLLRAEEWKKGPGGPLLSQAFAALDEEDVLARLDELVGGDPPENEIEEALYDVDEVVAAAIWSGHPAAVRSIAANAAETVRMVPESFADVADLGAAMARMPAVGRDLDLYDFWMAVADAGNWAEAS